MELNLLFVSDYEIIPEPARTIIIALQISVAIGCILIGLTAFKYFKKNDPHMSRTYFFGIPLFFLLVGVARFILVYHDYYAPDTQDIPLWALANLIIFSGFISLNYTVETKVYTKTRHFFTIFGISITILYFASIFIDKFLATIVLYIAIAFQFLPTLGIYLIIAKNSTGGLKKKAIIIVIGMLILLLSQSTSLLEMIGLMDRISSSIFGPPVALTGLSLLGWGLVRSK